MESIKGIIKRGLMKRKKLETDDYRSRRIRYVEDEASDRFTLIILLMIIFFIGLLSLEMFHIALLGSWNDLIFNGIMLVVGTIVGAIWGNQQ